MKYWIFIKSLQIHQRDRWFTEFEHISARLTRLWSLNFFRKYCLHIFHVAYFFLLKVQDMVFLTQTSSRACSQRWLMPKGFFIKRVQALQPLRATFFMVSQNWFRKHRLTFQKDWFGQNFFGLRDHLELFLLCIWGFSDPDSLRKLILLLLDLRGPGRICNRELPGKDRFRIIKEYS